MSPFSGRDGEFNEYLAEVLRSLDEVLHDSFQPVFVTEAPAACERLATEFDAPVIEMPLHHFAQGIQDTAAQKQPGGGAGTITLPSSSGVPIQLEPKTGQLDRGRDRVGTGWGTQIGRGGHRRDLLPRWHGDVGGPRSQCRCPPRRTGPSHCGSSQRLGGRSDHSNQPLPSSWCRWDNCRETSRLGAP